MKHNQYSSNPDYTPQAKVPWVRQVWIPPEKFKELNELWYAAKLIFARIHKDEKFRVANMLKEILATYLKAKASPEETNLIPRKEV